MFRHFFGWLVISATAIPSVAAESDELHLVSISSVRNARAADNAGKQPIEVDRPGKRVTLVVSSGSKLTWEISVTEKTTLSRIVLAGTVQQSVTGVSADTEVIKAFKKGEGTTIVLPYAADNAIWRGQLRKVHELTGLEANSFFGSYFTRDKPIRISECQDAPWLLTNFPQPIAKKDVPEVRFSAVHLVPDKRGSSIEGFYGDFTLLGPDESTLRHSPAEERELVFDAEGKQLYSVNARVSLEPKAVEALPPFDGAPGAAGNSSGSPAFDSKRKRLVVAKRSGLAAYLPAEKTWTSLYETGNRPGITMGGALAYASTDDCFYCIAASFTPVYPYVLEITNGEGAVLRRKRLAGPIFPGLLEPPPNGGAVSVQLIAVKHDLVMLVSRAERDGRTSTRTVEHFLYVIDPASGKSLLTARY